MGVSPMPSVAEPCEQLRVDEVEPAGNMSSLVFCILTLHPTSYSDRKTALDINICIPTDRRLHPVTRTVTRT